MKIYRQTFTENIYSENNAKLFMCWWVAGMNSTLSIHWKLILFVHSQNSCFEKLHKHQRKTSVTYIKKRDSGVNFFLWVLLHFSKSLFYRVSLKDFCDFFIVREVCFSYLDTAVVRWYFCVPAKEFKLLLFPLMSIGLPFFIWLL